MSLLLGNNNNVQYFFKMCTHAVYRDTRVCDKNDNHIPNVIGRIIMIKVCKVDIKMWTAC